MNNLRAPSIIVPARSGFFTSENPVESAYLERMTDGRTEVDAVAHWLLGADTSSLKDAAYRNFMMRNLRTYISDGGTGWYGDATADFGNGLVASCTTTPGTVKSVTVSSGGSGYVGTSGSYVDVRFVGGGGFGARGVALVTSGAIASVTMQDGGYGYTSSPTVEIVDGSGTGAVLTANLEQSLKKVTVTSGGSGYTTPPTVTVTGGTSGTNSKARCFSVISAGAVTAVYVEWGGYGYISAPTIGFTGGSGSGATATATIGPNCVTSMRITNSLDAVSSNLTASFSGSGSGAVGGAIISDAPSFSSSYMTIPAPASVLNLQSLNGMQLPFEDDGTFTLLVVFRYAASGSLQVIAGSSNAASANGGWEVYSQPAGTLKYIDYNGQAVAATISLPSGISGGDWTTLVYTTEAIAGESVQPSSLKVQKTNTLCQIGDATAITTSYERVDVAPPRNLGVGNIGHQGSFQGAVEIAEVIIFDKALTTTEIAALKTRTAARMSDRGITLVM